MKIKQNLKEIWDFINSKELYHSSASLGFYSVLAIMPFIFIVLSIFLKMEIFEKYYSKCKDFIFQNLLPNNQILVSQYADKFLQNSNDLGLFGLGAIFVTSVLFFLDYEHVVSKITNTEKRSLIKGVMAFFLMLILIPIVLVFSFYLSSNFMDFLAKFGNANAKFAVISPFLIIWLLFGISYSVSLNRKAEFKSVLFSSFVSSVLWEIGKILFIKYALLNRTYETIYGSFSVVFFFLLWIYISWILYLFGLKLCVIFVVNDEISAQKSDFESTNHENRDI